MNWLEPGGFPKLRRVHIHVGGASQFAVSIGTRFIVLQCISAKYVCPPIAGTLGRKKADASAFVQRLHSSALTMGCQTRRQWSRRGASLGCEYLHLRQSHRKCAVVNAALSPADIPAGRSDPKPRWLSQSAAAFIAASSFLISSGLSCGRSSLIVNLLSLDVSLNGGL